MLKCADSENSNYWSTSLSLGVGFSTNEFPHKTDVLIIGSGYTGMVTALQLRRSHVDVTLIDQTLIGSEASAKNGGMVLTGLSVGLSTILDRFGREKMASFFRESLESISCVEKLVYLGKIDCHFNRSGCLQAAYRPRHYEGLKKEQEFLSQYLNYETRLIPAEQMSDEIGSALYCGGLLDFKSAGIHPARYIGGLVRMAGDAGVDLHECVVALQIEPVEGKYRVKTSRGTIVAENVVIATNGYTTNLTPWHMKRVVAVESFMIATQELSEKEAQLLIPQNRMVFDTKRFLYYFRLSPDGKRLLFGGRPKKPHKSLSDRTEQIRRDMIEVFPQLAKSSIDYAWSGKLAFTTDRMPIIGEHKGLYYAMGYCGHGVGLATYFGFKLADMILGKNVDTVFRNSLSVPIPFYSGRPWFLPIAHSYYRILDHFF